MQALRRSDGPRRICRARRRHDADGPCREGALVFRSKNYFLELFGRRLFLPEWLTPGTLYVTHAELHDGKFSFTLQIFHPRFGLLLRQMAIFREIAP